MSNKLSQDFIEADIWEMEEKIKEINKILHGDEKDLKEAIEKEKKMEEREKNKKLLAEIKAREQYQKLLNGYPGKGEGKNYDKFCPHCFYEYNLKELDECTHCHKKLITQEERHKILKQKLEVYKEKQKNKKFRKMKYNNWIKSHGEIKILDASRHGPTNYTKWDMYESDSDEEEKEPILPRHDPNFIALEKSMNADLKKKEESQRKSLKLKEEGNKAFKEKKYKKAINLYSEAIEETRGIMHLYTNRAMAYIQVEEYNKAIEDCDRVIQYYELFEEELNKNVDTYTKALVRKAKGLLAIKDYQEAKDTIDKAIDYNEGNEEIIKFQKEIDNLLNLNKKSKEALKKNKEKNEENFNKINTLIVEIKKRLYDKEIVKKKELIEIINEVKNIFEKENKKLASTTKDNNYILFFSISGGIEIIFNFLNSQANTDSDILTELLQLLLIINSNPKYMSLINEIKGYNHLIEFLFKTESQNSPEEKKPEKKLAINLAQADIILTLLEKATLDDSCRKKITDIEHIDLMAKIVLSKYELSQVEDIKTANLLSKIYTFICNICYSTTDIRSKIAKGISDSFFKQLNKFIEKYNIEKEYYRNLLGAVLSFIINMANDLPFRKKVSEEKKFLKFLSENLLVNLINNELFIKEEIDDLYEKTCSLFYNVSFIPGEEINIIKYYLEIHIESFLFYYIIYKYRFKTVGNEDKNLFLQRSLMLLLRIVKFNLEIFSKESKVPEKDELLNKLLEFMDEKYLINCPIIIDYCIKIWIYLIKSGYEKLNENERIKKLIQSCCNILSKEVKNDLSGINDKNMERIINNMSLIIAIMGIYKDLSKEVKIIIPLAINICKEKTELLRKNAAILMARYAKCAPENEEYLRLLHGMEVLVSVSGHLKI